MNKLLKISLSLLIMISVFSCQTKVEPLSLMELNRSGQWKKVKTASSYMIINSKDYTAAEFRDIYFQLIYSEVRLNEIPQAKIHIEELEIYILENGLPDNVLWVEIELKKLKQEIS